MSSSYHPNVSDTDVRMLKVRTWRTEEGEEPTAYFQIHLLTKHSLLSNSRSGFPFTVIHQRESPVSLAFFQIQMSSMENPATSYHCIFHMLCTVGADPSHIENLIDHISILCRESAEETVRNGLSSMEILIRIEVQLREFYDSDIAFPLDTLGEFGDQDSALDLAMMESMNDADDARAMAHGSRSTVEIEALLETCQIDRWDYTKDCSICLELLSEEVVHMPCSHLFHRSCIGRWLEISDLCPMCRAII
ncbi:uncharacterized protein LOC131229455 [Magnolia sinica]|uniref:uncharacterized protein LOC131229455 n=1 Tax=Magnolia sinica TaxID=86752 RepID=UPI0026593164|nr:uncharacterized protein LOC131229455 [Magnolia sinica]